jgi:hypothetical protein
MKKTKKFTGILAAILAVSLLFALAGCGGGQSSRNSDSSGQGSQSAAEDPDSGQTANEEAGGRLLIYTEEGVKIYAGAVRFDGATAEEYAKISVLYTIVNDLDDSYLIELTPEYVNGAPNAKTGGSGLIANRHMTMEDSGEYTNLAIIAKDFGLTVEQTEDGRYAVDKSIAYTISGTLTSHAIGEVYKEMGTFTLTIPANFPEDEFRTDEVWTITK